MLPEAFEAALADPPQVHPLAASGVFGTDPACYDLIAHHVGPTSVTVETGLGLSTVLFAMSGCRHTAIFWDPAEGEALAAWAGTHGVDLSKITLLPGGSEAVLPTLELPELDLFFIDGQHGYPVPQMDWLFGAPRVRRDGIVVVDDVQLYAPGQLADFLDADARWARLDRQHKWAAYRRLSEGPLNSDWEDQPFPPRKPPMTLVDRSRELAHHLPEPVRNALKKAKNLGSR